MESGANKIKDVSIFDARDKIAVYGNMIIGKGAENEQFYQNCLISFNNLPNM